MLNIAVCEDTQADMDLLLGHILRYMGSGSYTLKTFSEAAELMLALPSGAFDIIFMDIVIKQDNGIDLTVEINRLLPDARVIFQSSNIEFFKSVYKTNHIYFLLKPVDYEDFSSAMDKALKSLEKAYLAIKGKEKIKCADIIYIELINHDMVFWLKNGDSITTRLKTNALLDLLPQSFVRCHKSYIVNIDCISSYQKSKKYITIENEQIIPIGNKYAEEVAKNIMRCWGQVIC